MKQTKTTGRVRDPEATRERLLECAFDEMYEKGYAGASLDQILADSGVTKGALYHHFGSKAELALAVIDEIIRPFLLERWVEPVRAADDPVAGFRDMAMENFSNMEPRLIEWGCPLNNLSQELSTADEIFRTRLNSVFEEWRGGLADAFARGQERGTVRADVDPTAVASFIVAGIEGLATTLKTSRDFEVARSAVEVFLQFIEGLRPAAERPAA